MKKILLLATGGTIASRPGREGLSPQLQGEDILRYIREFTTDYALDYRDILQLDSSNIQPEEWRTIARRVHEALPSYDGVIVTHGTDTMAYTASALSFMLLNLTKPVVLTGSQLPIDMPLTDARTNLYTALAAVDADICGVSVAFNRKIICGCRTVKVSTMGFDAFESVNASYLGQIFADGLRRGPQAEKPLSEAGERNLLRDRLCPDVFLLKLLPGTKPELFGALRGLGYRGVVLETFGAGGLHYLHRDLICSLGKLVASGVAVVACSQCLYERSDLSLYEVGQRLLQQGVIPGRDMTTEAAATKLMWCLGQTDSLDEIRTMFAASYAGEITV